MISVAIRMLVADRGKFAGLVAGVAFAAFLSCFAACYFAGFMTRSFALVAEQPADVWVMDPVTAAPDQYANLPGGARDRVRSTPGVARAVVLALGHVDARLPDGDLLPVDIVGLDDADLPGAPALPGGAVRAALRMPDAAIAAAGGTEGKLVTADRPRGGAPRPLRAGDELSVADHRIVLAGIAQSLPRFPPRPLLYMSYGNALRVLPPERLRTSFVTVAVEPGRDPAEVARLIAARTGLKAMTRDAFADQTVRWTLATSEDVGDIATMLTVSVAIGFGFTAVMLYIFTTAHLRQYGVLVALGARPGVLARMIAVQAGLAGLLGSGIGVGACAVVGLALASDAMPFRMLWWAPVGALVLNLIACAAAAAACLIPVLRAEPARVFAP